ncbi:unnamed protein product [Colias eurytheme]|nr:unnamed protein product [Colias eurytheme]
MVAYYYRFPKLEIIIVRSDAWQAARQIARQAARTLTWAKHDIHMLASMSTVSTNMSDDLDVQLESATEHVNKCISTKTVCF